MPGTAAIVCCLGIGYASPFAAHAKRKDSLVSCGGKWGQVSWVKKAQNVNGVEIHYVKNTKTGEIVDFKFAE